MVLQAFLHLPFLLWIAWSTPTLCSHLEVQLLCIVAAPRFLDDTCKSIKLSLSHLFQKEQLKKRTHFLFKSEYNSFVKHLTPPPITPCTIWSLQQFVHHEYCHTFLSTSTQYEAYNNLYTMSTATHFSQHQLIKKPTNIHKINREKHIFLTPTFFSPLSPPPHHPPPTHTHTHTRPLSVQINRLWNCQQFKHMPPPPPNTAHSLQDSWLQIWPIKQPKRLQAQGVLLKPPKDSKHKEFYSCPQKTPSTRSVTHTPKRLQAQGVLLMPPKDSKHKECYSHPQKTPSIRSVTHAPKRLQAQGVLLTPPKDSKHKECYSRPQAQGVLLMPPRLQAQGVLLTPPKDSKYKECYSHHQGSWWSSWYIKPFSLHLTHPSTRPVLETDQLNTAHNLQDPSLQI